MTSNQKIEPHGTGLIFAFLWFATISKVSETSDYLHLEKRFASSYH